MSDLADTVPDAISTPFDRNQPRSSAFAMLYAPEHGIYFLNKETMATSLLAPAGFDFPLIVR